MDSLYMTGLPDSLTLQEMLDCDIKTEMDVDDCFSLGELPPLALEDSLDAKWEFIDTTTSGSGLLFSRVTPLHSPGSDMTMWFNAGGSGGSGVGGNCSNQDLDPAAMMVNPSSVMPLPVLVPAPPPAVTRAAPVTVVAPTPITTQAAAATVVTTHITMPTVQTPITARAKISGNSINIVCNQNAPFTIVRTSSISAATSSTLAQADSNTGLNIRTPAGRCKLPPHPQADFEAKAYPKPAYSYSCLIALALKNSSNGSLPVSEIYNFMCEHFPYFKTAPNGWKNSVRHNLSLNKCFEKIEKPSGNGSQRKGCLWAMNPAKLSKMDEEVQKWSRKDPHAIRRAMVVPDHLEMLERGEMKRELPSSSTLSGEDTEEEEEEEAEVAPTSPPVSPPREQPFTPPHVAARRGMGDSDPIAQEDTDDEEDFVDIGALDQLGDQSLSEFDLDVNEGLYEELGEERLNLGINISTPTKLQGNYICKASPGRTLGHQSYICKPSSTSTIMRLKKVQPAILLSTTKRQL